jgi:hypothetical protein
MSNRLSKNNPGTPSFLDCDEAHKQRHQNDVLIVPHFNDAYHRFAKQPFV